MNSDNSEWRDLAKHSDRSTETQKTPHLTNRPTGTNKPWKNQVGPPGNRVTARK